MNNNFFLVHHLKKRLTTFTITNLLNNDLLMKHSYFSLMMTLCIASSMSAQNSFNTEQVFNRGQNPVPYTGLDILRKNNPYMIIRNISNATNGRQFNKEKYVTIPYMTGNNLYGVLGSYTYDSLSKQWKKYAYNQYFILYDFNSKSVPEAYIRQTYADSLKNKYIKTNFRFSGKNMPDTQYFYTIGASDTSYTGRNVFYYDTSDQLIHISRHNVSGSSVETFYAYTKDGRICNELRLEANTPFSTLDSVYQSSYDYDSSGKLLSFKEEVYDQAGRADMWTVKQMSTYTYNPKGLLSGDRMYTPDSSNDLTLESLHLYTYTNDNQIETYIQMRSHNGVFTERHKLEVFYEGSQAKYGYEYPWEDNDYSHIATRYYVFGSEDLLSVQTDLQVQKQFHVYPNPANHTIDIEVDASRPLNICDLSGHIVMHVPENHNRMVDISALNSGIYVIMVDDYMPLKLIKN